MTKATNTVARVAAAVAGLGLVAMSFAPAVGAASTTTTTTTTTTSASFSRNLTVGSTGADVSALQNWLISMKYSIPAGATGYFGAQTKAAVAAFQAANGITPAVGFFGPITRAKVASMGGSTTTGGSTGSTGGLSGGEASIRSFNLMNGNDIAQGDTNREIGVARFDVRSGDINVQRVTVELTATGVGSKLPWKYFDMLSVYNGNTKIGSVSVGSKSDWSQSGNTYSVDISTNGVVKQGDNRELSIRADAASSINTADQGQVFSMDIPANGIRAIDSAGIQNYAGIASDTVNVGISAAQNGNLVVTAASNNPSSAVLVADTSKTSSDYDVLSFSIRNKDDASVDFNTLTFTASNTASTTAITNIVRRATLTLDGNTYTGTIGSGGNTTIVFDKLSSSVKGKSSVNGKLTVTLYGQSGHFAATGEAIKFTLVGNTTNVDASNSSTGDASTVTGTATGNTMSIGVNTGITVKGGSNSATESYNSNTPASSTGTFTLKFDVTANGNDVYIPKTVATTSGSTGNTGVVVYSSLAGSTAGLSVPASLSSTALVDGSGNFYVVHAGDTETFTAQVTFDPASAGYYQVGLDKVRYNDTASLTGLQTLDVDETKAEMQTSQLYVH